MRQMNLFLNHIAVYLKQRRKNLGEGGGLPHHREQGVFKISQVTRAGVQFMFWKKAENYCSSGRNKCTDVLPNMKCRMG